MTLASSHSVFSVAKEDWQQPPLTSVDGKATPCLADVTGFLCVLGVRAQPVALLSPALSTGVLSTVAQLIKAAAWMGCIWLTTA